MVDGQEKVGLIRGLGLFDITMVGVGAMIGAGIFVLTGIAAGAAGPALMLAFVLNGIVTIFTAMVYAELGSAIPEAGGGYLWIKEGLPAWNAFLAGWMSWFAHAVAGSLYALGFGAYLQLMLRALGLFPAGISDDLFQKIVAVLVVLAFTAVNFKGVSETGKIGNAITLGKILILVVFIVTGLAAIARHPVYLSKFTPFAPKGFGGVLTAMGLTFIAFEGYEIIVQAGEEVVNPRKNIPKAVFLSLAIVIPIYVLVAFAAIGAVNPAGNVPTWQWLGQHAELGLAEAARQFMPLGATLLLVGGLLSTTSALNATTFSSTRVAFAMGRDRNLPDLFGRIHERTRTPYLALAFSAVLMTFMAVAMPIEDVAAAADVMFLLLFLQVNIAVLTIRKKYGDKLNYGYIMPFFPVAPILAIISLLFLALFMFHYSIMAWCFVLGWIGAGMVIYRSYAARREREKVVTPVILHEKPAPAGKRFRVAVAVANPNAAGPLLQTAARIARPMDGELLLLHVATVPPQTPLTADRALLTRSRAVVDAVAAATERLKLDWESLVRVGRSPSLGIIHTVEETRVDFLVMGWWGPSRDPHTKLGRNLDYVLRHTPCHTLVIHQWAVLPAPRIVIPVANPQSANQLLAVGRLLLDKSDPSRRITVLFVVRPDTPPAERERRVTELKKSLAKPAFFDPPEAELSLDGHPVSLKIVESRSTAGAILAETEQADLLIVGSSQRAWLHRRIFGDFAYDVARSSACPVVMLSQQTAPFRFTIQKFFQFFRELDESQPGS